MKPIRISQLDRRTIVRWVGTEMALSGCADDRRPVVWSHPSVPYLQFINLDVQLYDGSIYRMLSAADDGSGHFGLYLIHKNVIDEPSSFEGGSIYRTRVLSELPVGTADVVVTEHDGPSSDLRVKIVVNGHAISCWAAEVYERNTGDFQVCGRDESILVQVDGKYPCQSG